MSSEPLPTTMLALHLTSPSSLSLTNLPIPTPNSSQVLIRISSSPILPSDILNHLGKFPQTTYPITPGRDFSGTIIQSPSKPSLINKPVYGTSGNSLSFTSNGTHAQYLLLPLAAVAEKPSNLSFEEASTVGVIFTTANLAVKKGEVKKGEKVLVLGANGIVGKAAVQIASSLGANVLRGVRGKEGDIDTSSAIGIERIDELTEGKGVDVVIDTVGNPSLSSAAGRKLGRGGRMVVIAAAREGEERMEVDLLGWYRGEKRLIGVNTLLYGVEEFAEELRGMKGLFEEGKLRVEGKWEKVRLEDGVEGYERAGKKGGKVLLVMD